MHIEAGYIFDQTLVSPPPLPELLAVSQAGLFLGREGNIRGEEMERKITGILNCLPEIKRIIPAQTYREWIDLTVELDSDVSAEESVFVQAKSSTRGLEHFKEKLIAHLRRTNRPHDAQNRRLWMLENKLILLNGGVRISHTGQHEYPVTEIQVVESFRSQLEAINDYWLHKSKPYEISGLPAIN